jgi:hypothetical protein
MRAKIHASLLTTYYLEDVYDAASIFIPQLLIFLVITKHLFSQLIAAAPVALPRRSFSDLGTHHYLSDDPITG